MKELTIYNMLENVKKPAIGCYTKKGGLKKVGRDIREKEFVFTCYAGKGFGSGSDKEIIYTWLPKRLAEFCHENYRDLYLRSCIQAFDKIQITNSSKSTPKSGAL